MIEIGHVIVPSAEQLEFIIEGARNPMNSWRLSDSKIMNDEDGDYLTNEFVLGEKDRNLMMKLAKAGTDHRKFMRMLTAMARVTAPLYWWKEADTYRMGVEKNSCSTMHKISEKPFILTDFSCEHMHPHAMKRMLKVLKELNLWRDIYLEGGEVDIDEENKAVFLPLSKDAWWQLIQLLPSSYNQTRNVMFSYESLANIYKSRKNHKLDEWHDFCNWVETLPYSFLITGNCE